MIYTAPCSTALRGTSAAPATICRKWLGRWPISSRSSVLKTTRRSAGYSGSCPGRGGLR
jgi:hypothetical protein